MCGYSFWNGFEVVLLFSFTEANFAIIPQDFLSAYPIKM